MKRFEEGLRTTIWAPVTTSTNWSDFLSWSRQPCELRDVWPKKRKEFEEKKTSPKVSQEEEEEEESDKEVGKRARHYLLINFKYLINDTSFNVLLNFSVNLFYLFLLLVHRPKTSLLVQVN